jgi:type IV secretion system protein TrbL
MPTDMGGLDRFLHAFTSAIGVAYGLIGGDVQWLFNIMIIIVLTLSGLWWAFGDGDRAIVDLIRKVLLIGFFAFVLVNWHSLTKTIAQTMVYLGLRAGNSVLTVNDFFTPSTIAYQGFSLTNNLISHLEAITGPVGFFENLWEILVLAVASLGIIFAFCFIAIQILVAVIEFHIVSLAAFVTVPLAIWTKTAFIAERPIAYPIASGLKLLTLAVVVSIGQGVMATLTPSPEPTAAEAYALLFASLSFLMLAWKIPQLAAALICGGPSLSATGMVGAVGSTVSSYVLGYQIARGMARAGVGIASAAGRGMAGAAQAAARLPDNIGGTMGKRAVDTGHITRNAVQDAFPRYQSPYARPRSEPPTVVKPGSTAAAMAQNTNPMKPAPGYENDGAIAGSAAGARNAKKPGMAADDTHDRGTR